MKNLYKNKMAYVTMYAVILLATLTLSINSFGQARMRANLLIVDANGTTTTLMDGNMTNYNNIYSNAIDGQDIRKMTNFGENFGILRSTTNLVVERRSLIQQNDTTYFRMWNLQPRNYRLQVIAENLHNSNLLGFVRDSYLNQDFPIKLNDTTNLDFAVNSNSGTFASNRFTLIYTKVSVSSGVLPVNFTGLTASRKNNQVQLSFSVANEVNMDHYVVQHSADGRHFTDINTVQPFGNSSSKTYQVADVQSASTTHFYRIKGVSIGGKEQFSSIAKVSAVGSGANISVYPNPVADKKMQLELNNAQLGIHQLLIIGTNGQKLMLPNIRVAGSQQTQTIQLPSSIKAGVYQLQVIAPDAATSTKTIIVL